MKKPWLVHAPVVFYCLISLSLSVSPRHSRALFAADLARGFADRTADDLIDLVLDDPNVPVQILDLMRLSQKHYQDGSDLIKSGNAGLAREAFNHAVSTILESEWDLGATPVLDRYFQSLMRRIQEDEARYLRRQEDTAEESEPAAVDELEKINLIPIAVDPSLKDFVEADLASTKYDLPVMLNETVLQSLNFWLNQRRKYFSDGLIRSGRYREMIQRIFREAALPLDLMYLAQVESLFKPNAFSRKQAKGIWQFGRSTAIRYGLKVNSYVDERSDPEKSTRAAARYLSDLYAMFGDWNLVLAAYNWGEGRVQRLIDRKGSSDFWDLQYLRRTFPKETKNHVPLIMASIILGRNPTKYGLPMELDPPLAFDRVVLPKAIDLRAASKALDVPVEQLKELNPELRRFSTPVGYPNYELKLPPGKGTQLEQSLASLPAVKPDSRISGKHRIREGDTLFDIARHYKVSVEALQRVNNIRSPKTLRVGMWLIIPTVRTTNAKTFASNEKVGSR